MIDPRAARSRSGYSWARILQTVQHGEIISYESSFHLPGSIGAGGDLCVPGAAESEDDLQWTVRDITARKELDILRNDLAAMVYHDLRSPLSNVISSLDMLEGSACLWKIRLAANSVWHCGPFDRPNAAPDQLTAGYQPAGSRPADHQPEDGGGRPAWSRRQSMPSNRRWKANSRSAEINYAAGRLP